MLRKSIDFVIPDDRLRVGTKSLTHFKSLTPCPDQEVCPSSSQERHTPPPAFHIHIEDSEVTVALYLQSETLWFLPPLDSSFSFPKRLELPSQFILAATRLFSHLGGRVGDRVSSSRAVIQSSSPSLTSCWKPFCVCTRAIQGSA